MSVYGVRPVGCGWCGHVFTAEVVDSANPWRHPPYLQQLLDRRFQTFECPRCEHSNKQDVPLLWTDVRHRLLAWVAPTSDRPSWSRIESDVEAALRVPTCEEGPSFVRSWGATASLRLVFGLEELREKVVAHIAGVDDRVVEVLKLAFVDPVEATGPVLERVDEAGLHLGSATVAADGAEVTGVAGVAPQEVAMIPWDVYNARRSALLDVQDPAHVGLWTGTWVHWMRAAFPR